MKFGMKAMMRSMLLLWVATQVVHATSPNTTSARPNFLFILADQWRASAFGYAGDPNVKTPNLDRLARQSLNFRNAMSVCAVCTPYRAALLTGRFPTSTGMFLNDACLPEEELCLAQVLKQEGYATGYIGKWHLDGHGRSSFIPPERRRGFDYWKVAECEHNYTNSHYYYGNSSIKKFWEGYDAFAQTRDAQQFLREHAGVEKPFFLFLAYGIPHFPHGSAPPEYKAMYPPDQLQFLPNVPEEMRTPKVRLEAQGYYAHCTALDKCVGELLRTLEESDLARNTVLIFTSDHGEMMGSQGCPPYMKQVPWNEAAHVPMLLRYPAVHGAAGREIRTPLTTPDLFATVIALSGGRIPSTAEGRDFSPLILGRQTEADCAALFMGVAPFNGGRFQKAYRAIRTADFTYVRGLEGPWLLYRNETDPWQTNNLATNAQYSLLRTKMDKRLRAELRRIGDDFQAPQYYIDRFGYEVAPHGSISYAQGARPQSPKRIAQ